MDQKRIDNIRLLYPGWDTVIEVLDALQAAQAENERLRGALRRLVRNKYEHYVEGSTYDMEADTSTDWTVKQCRFCETVFHSENKEILHAADCPFKARESEGK